jgi:hypothetical protein
MVGGRTPYTIWSLWKRPSHWPRPMIPAPTPVASKEPEKGKNYFGLYLLVGRRTPYTILVYGTDFQLLHCTKSSRDPGSADMTDGLSGLNSGAHDPNLTPTVHCSREQKCSSRQHKPWETSGSVKRLIDRNGPACCTGSSAGLPRTAFDRNRHVA